MCDKDILEKGGTFKYIPNCYKNQEMSIKVVDNYTHPLEFVPDCYMPQKKCEETVDNHSSTTKLVSESYKTQEICDKFLINLFWHLFILLINIKLKKCVTELFRKILFQ